MDPAACRSRATASEWCSATRVGNIAGFHLLAPSHRGAGNIETGRVCKGNSVTSDPQNHDHPDATAADATAAGSAAGSAAGTAAGASAAAEQGRLGALSETEVRELAEIPAVEVITRACVMLMSAAAEKLGLAEDGDRYLDLDEARRLITAYAGLLTAAAPDLGVHRQPLRDGLRALQAAFREASPYPDAPGEGPGERPA